MKNRINLLKNYDYADSNLFIILVFALLSFISGVILLKSQVFGFNYDVHFHWQRIQELKDSIGTNSFFSDVAMNRFFQSGSAVMSMYPKINVIPMVIISLFLKSFVNVFYVSFILRNFLALIVAYFSCYKFNENKKSSFLFSITYTFSTMSLCFSFQMTDIGVTSSLIYLPMVLFGTFALINDYKWKELSIGITAIFLSHIISAIMAIILSACIILINFKCIRNKKFIISSCKAISIVVLITGIFWLPFSQLILNNRITMPITTPQLEGLDIYTWLLPSFNNSISPYITIFAIIGFVLSLIRYKYLSKYSKQIFLLASIVLFIGTPFFPWNLLQHTFLLTTFQFTWRIYMIPQLLLCYLFAEQIVTIFGGRKQLNISLLLLTVIVMFAQVSGQKSIVDSDRLNSIKQDSLNSLYFDYLPKGYIYKNFNDHKVINGDNKKVTTSLLGNGKFSFKLDKFTKSLKMPFFIYNNINYQVKVDGKNTKFHSDDHSQLTLGHMNKGKHTVQVIVHKSWYDYLSYVLSVIGVMVLAFAWIRSLILKRNKYCK